ncbi:hypothetical protein [Natrinema halophilum]|uniref:Uncharacterized protein n=1 Tax=Natrinema halophilum TaxID=1699371 RepID=A0A7D5K7E8_9EURY|nr:hypothetical protein [Natrinema halophilum]QLG49923.1 hypothetical protein HYG82_14200 [Natrinema halophilum]
MYHPTPYHWQTDDGLTHVFYDNHVPPDTGFGWSSLCDAIRVPIEGEHFELREDVTADDITCGHCLNRLDRPSTDFDGDSIGCVNGCLVLFDRDQDGVIVRAESVCRTVLHHSMPFEPESFTGNLKDQCEDVCRECWGTYVDHQWTDDDEGAELRIDVSGDDERSEYFAASAEPIQGDDGAILQLQSENGLETEIDREAIESITLTPMWDIVY